MKNLFKLFFFSLLFFTYKNSAQAPKTDTIKTYKGDLIIQPIFHGAMVLKWKQKTIYIDPYNGKWAYKGLPKPDFILITHIHQDHMDINTLNELDLIKAKLIVPQAVADLLPIKWKNKEVVLNNNKTFTTSDISITAVPMYDLPQDSNSRHKKGEGNGYIIELGGKRIYISGDTDDIPEMRTLKNIDVAFVCMNEPFTMTIQQAASAVLEFKPKIIYPYHYRNKNGFTDILAFGNIINTKNNNIEVRTRNWYNEVSSANKVTKIENVSYRRVSGISLTMDVYKPEKSNNIGIIAIDGGAFGYAYAPEYSPTALTRNFAKDTTYFGKYGKNLVEKGYTLFVINHRFAPQFHYQDIISDCQRAVRFVRFNAKKYGIDPANIGAFGYSSGGTLCAMLGVTDLDNKANLNEIDSVSSRVQSVIALAARFDLADFNKKEDTTIHNTVVSKVLLNYIGELPKIENGEYVLTDKYAAASPISYVDKEDAPFLIYCSNDDPFMPLRQENNMYLKLQTNGVDSKLNIKNKEGHTPIPDIEEMDKWLLKYLKK